MLKIIGFFIVLLSSSFSFAETDDPANALKPVPLDGVLIEAVETYKNPKKNEFLYGLGVYPLNEFYNGFSLSGSYNNYFDKTFGWEVINAAFVYSVDSDVSSQLAEDFGVNPERIERLNFIFSSNFIFIPAYGKIVMFKKYIRYYRLLLIGGLGVVMTSIDSYLAPVIGTRLDFQVSESFSFKLDIRDNISLGSDIDNHLAITLYTGFNY